MDEDKFCPACGSPEAECPECGSVAKHGGLAKCCKRFMECAWCGRGLFVDGSELAQGILTHDGVPVRYGDPRFPARIGGDL